MVKALDAPYEAGRRGGELAEGQAARTRSTWWCSRPSGDTAAARAGSATSISAPATRPTGGFVMLGKTFKGMTDEMLGWQTQKLLELETSRDGHTVHVRPELVVEVAFDGLQQSSRYPGGLALRFARVKGYRPDKSAAQADTIQTVRQLATSS